MTLDDVRAAAERIRPWVHRTPLVASAALSGRFGCEVRLKCENLQRAGAFKIRGAMNALLQLTKDERSRGVVAFSSGNHAQGVALAARLLGVRATIVMPEGSVASKVAATEGYGATVVQSGVTSATRGEKARQIADETGASIIPPFEDARVIAGAGTVGLEIAQEWPEAEMILVPVGGGGLIAGTALAATSLMPEVRVIGVEPAAGNDAEQSFRSGSVVEIAPPKTIADGARTTAIGQLNFDIIRQCVADIVSVEDDILLETMKFAIYRTKLLIEPTGALGLAALAAKRVRPPSRVAVVLSGGNLDLSLLCN